MSHCLTCTCGLKRTKVYYLYKIWSNIKNRTTNPNNPDYKNYGARGIYMHKEWFDSFDSFEFYVLTNIGHRSSNTSLDRIDNEKGYLPGNLKWSSYSEQLKNRRKFVSKGDKL